MYSFFFFFLKNVKYAFSIIALNHHWLQSTMTYLQEVSNQINGLTGDIFPHVMWVHEWGILYLLVYVLIFVEGEGARQTHLQVKKVFTSVAGVGFCGK